MSNKQRLENVRPQYLTVPAKQYPKIVLSDAFYHALATGTPGLVILVLSDH